MFPHLRCCGRRSCPPTLQPYDDDDYYYDYDYDYDYYSEGRPLYGPHGQALHLYC